MWGLLKRLISSAPCAARDIYLGKLLSAIRIFVCVKINAGVHFFRGFAKNLFAAARYILNWHRG